MQRMRERVTLVIAVYYATTICATTSLSPFQYPQKPEAVKTYINSVKSSLYPNPTRTDTRNFQYFIIFIFNDIRCTIMSLVLISSHLHVIDYSRSHNPPTEQRQRYQQS